MNRPEGDRFTDDSAPSGTWSVGEDAERALTERALERALDAGDWATAIVEAEELLDAHPHHAEGLFALAEASLELGDPATAADAFEDYVAIVTDNPAAWSGLAIARFEIIELPDAIVAAQRALELEPDLAEAHYTLGLTLERLGEETAADAFDRASSLEPDAYPLAFPLTDAQLESALQTAMARLPPELQDHWRAIPYILEEEPILADILGGFTRIPPTIVGFADEGEAPEQLPLQVTLRLFRKNLARSGSIEAVTDHIEAVLRSEAFLGDPD